MSHEGRKRSVGGRCRSMLPPHRARGRFISIHIDGAPCDEMAGRKRSGAGIFALAGADRPRVLRKQQLGTALREATAHPELESGFAQGRAALVEKGGQVGILV